MKGQLTIDRAQLEKAVKALLIAEGHAQPFDKIECLNAPALQVTITDGVPPTETKAE